MSTGSRTVRCVARCWSAPIGAERWRAAAAPGPRCAAHCKVHALGLRLLHCLAEWRPLGFSSLPKWRPAARALLPRQRRLSRRWHVSPGAHWSFRDPTLLSCCPRPQWPSATAPGAPRACLTCTRPPCPASPSGWSEQTGFDRAGPPGRPTAAADDAAHRSLLRRCAGSAWPPPAARCGLPLRIGSATMCFGLKPTLPN